MYVLHGIHGVSKTIHFEGSLNWTCVLDVVYMFHSSGSFAYLEHFGENGCVRISGGRQYNFKWEHVEAAKFVLFKKKEQNLYFSTVQISGKAQ